MQTYIWKALPTCEDAKSCVPIVVPAPNWIKPEMEKAKVEHGLSGRPKATPLSLPTNPPSALNKGEPNDISEKTSVREEIEKMFPNKSHEEKEIEEKESELLGPNSPGEPGRTNCLIGKPVNCATGNEIATQTDLSVGGRGPALQQALTYNSLLAAKQTTAGPFGFGWTGHTARISNSKKQAKKRPSTRTTGAPSCSCMKEKPGPPLPAWYRPHSQ